MSRLAKIAQYQILTQKPPKPSDEDLAFEVSGSPEKTIRKLCSSETADAIEDSSTFTTFKPTKIQQGMAKKVQKLFRALRAKDLRVRVPAHLEQRYEARESHALLISENPDVIGLDAYLKRFFQFGQVSDSVAVLAYVYIRRALAIDSSLKSKHFHKLVAGCLLLAHKFHNESCYWCFEDFGHLAGIDPEQVGNIEVYLADEVLEYSFYLDPKNYSLAKDSLIAYSYED